jgi:hypothetical protein
MSHVRLFGPAQLGSSPSDLYTVPTGTRAELRQISVSNPTGSTVDFTLSIGADGTATRLYDDYPIAADSSDNFKAADVLEAGEKIQAYAGTGAALVLTVGGITIDVGWYGEGVYGTGKYGE